MSNWNTNARVNKKRLFKKADDSNFKEELLNDFYKTMQLALEIVKSDVVNFLINLFLWIKNHIGSNINIKEEGYVSINEEIISSTRKQN